MTSKERAAVQAGYDALKDIINAADNGQPYTAEELKGSFCDACNLLYELLEE